MKIGSQVEIISGGNAGMTREIVRIIPPCPGCEKPLYVVRLTNGCESMYWACELRKMTEANQ